MLLEDASARGRRRGSPPFAGARVAEVLEEHEDARDLALSAKVLAWSEHDPAVEGTRAASPRAFARYLAARERRRRAGTEREAGER